MVKIVSELQDSLKGLLKIEKDANLWEHHASGIFLWPLVRAYVCGSSINHIHGYSQPHARGNYVNMLKPPFLREFLRAGYFWNSKKRNYDSVFFTTGRLQRLEESKRLYCDQLYSPYFSNFQSPLILEESYRFQISRPKEYGENIFLADYIRILAKMKSYRENLFKYEKSISDFTDELQKQFSPQIPLQAQKILRTQLPKVRHLSDYADNITSRMDGNIAFIHCASYLGLTGEITRRFKEHGIKVVEVQHGYVGPEHYAYNYPSGTAEKVMKEYLPDYYLTFGKYWGEQIQTPSSVVTVGNPTLNRSVDGLQTKSSPRPNSILVVSQGTVTSKMVKIAKYLSKTLPNYTIVFKLHPGEVPFTHRYEDLKKYHNVQIRTYDNIYELIASSEIIVGYNSTTLFEAVAFSGKRIFILNNDMIPDSLGYKFSSCEELRDAILDGESGYPSAQPSYFWEPDWETNIASFLKNLSL